MSKKIWCFLGVHEMEVIDRGPFRTIGPCGGTKARGSYFILQCKCCGKVRRTVLCG